MLVYIISFAISIFFYYLSEKHTTKKANKYLLVIISILIPSVLAGIRSSNVGTDVKIYLEPLFNLSLNSKTFGIFLSSRYTDYWHIINPVDFEIGFLFLTYIISKIFFNIYILQFIISFISISLVYAGIGRINVKNKWISIFIFYFLFYNLSLNVIRQFLGMSISFYAFTTIVTQENKKNSNYIRFFLMAILAFLFHKSSIIILPIFFVYEMFMKVTNKYFKINHVLIPIKKILFIIFLVLSIALIININKIFNLFSIFGIEKYIGYINGNFVFSLTKIVKNLPIIIILFLNWKKFNKKCSNCYFYMLIYVLSIVISLYSLIQPQAERISYLFQYFLMILIPVLFDSIENKSFKKICLFVVLSYIILYWYYFFVILGIGETVPFSCFNQ